MFSIDPPKPNKENVLGDYYLFGKDRIKYIEKYVHCPYCVYKKLKVKKDKIICENCGRDVKAIID